MNSSGVSFRTAAKAPAPVNSYCRSQSALGISTPRAPFASAPPTSSPPASPSPSPSPTAITIAIPLPTCRYNLSASKAGLWSDVHSLQSPISVRSELLRSHLAYTYAHSAESHLQEPFHVQPVPVRRNNRQSTRLASHSIPVPIIFEAAAGWTPWTSVEPSSPGTLCCRRRHSRIRSAYLPPRAATPSVPGP